MPMTLDVVRPASSRSHGPRVLQYDPMTSVRYVCLSDLHLGAENSLLSNVAPGETTVDLSEPSPVLVQLVERAQQSLLGRVGAGADGPKPTLVLNGDITELALARDEAALGVFTQFLELAFERHQLFDPVVVYLPGNHDHELWGSDPGPSFDEDAAPAIGASAWTSQTVRHAQGRSWRALGRAGRDAPRRRPPPRGPAAPRVRTPLPHLRGRGRPGRRRHARGRVPSRSFHRGVVGVDQRAAARGLSPGELVEHRVGPRRRELAVGAVHLVDIGAPRRVRCRRRRRATP